MNLSTGEELPIFVGPGDQAGPEIYEDIVVWTDVTDDIWDIRGYNLSTKEVFRISTAPGNRFAPAICKDVIVWIDDRNGNEDIYGCNLRTIRIGKADSLYDQGIEEFEKGTYETALTYFQQAKEIYVREGSEKAAQCDLWIEKIQAQTGTTLPIALPELTILIGIVLIFIILAGAAYYLIKMRKSKRSDSPD